VASGLSALTRIGLAFAGTGAWALIVGDASRGLYLLVGVLATSAFRPRLRFVFAEVRRFVSFGLRAASASVIFHAYRNIDYLVVGKVLGTETLGIYRVAFEVAMSPTETIIQVVNRVAFPVFSRIASDGHKLVDAFLAIARYTVFVTGPVAVFLYFGASDVIRTITHERWLAAVPAVQILCWGGLLRSLAQVFPQLFNAAGRPTLGIVDSIITFVLLGGTFTAGAVLFGDTLGVAAVCYGWLICYPVLLAALLVLARRAVPMTPWRYV
jgi:O-antigen/teichoic acid export membrane protein